MTGSDDVANAGPTPGKSRGTADLQRVDNVLVVNAGSTSVKLTRRRNGTDSTGIDLDEALWGEPADVVIHRIVHGGGLTGAVRLDEDVVTQLYGLVELAPQHQKPALEAIDRCRWAWPEATQFACFDTSFHAALPREARTYALPERLRDQVQVYGFHGLSYAWAAATVRRAAPAVRRMLVAHLGGGESLCGILDGRSMVTTMGFTPLDGLVMATRSGTIDPSALSYLARHNDVDLDTVLEHESGLLALAGSSDMQQVLRRRADGDPDADLAIKVWLHRFLREAGGCVAVLGGLDALVFTGGIGENSADIRSLVTDNLSWAGVPTANAVPSSSTDTIVDIGGPNAPVRVFVVHAREDLQMIAETAVALESDRGSPGPG